MVDQFKAFQPDVLLTLDDDAPDFVIPLGQRDGQPLNLTGATALFLHRKRDDTGPQSSKTASVVSPGVLGKVRVTMKSNPFTAAGDYLFEVKITQIDGTILHAPSGRPGLLRVRDRA